MAGGALDELVQNQERLSEILKVLCALLTKPSDNLRWAIQPKKLKPVVAAGLAAKDGQTRKVAVEVQDQLLRLGFFEFLKTEK